MILNSIGEMAKFFGKTRNACLYHIRAGRLPDPRNTGVEEECLAWPESEKVGRKRGSANPGSLRWMVSALAERVDALEKIVGKTQEHQG